MTLSPLGDDAPTIPTYVRVGIAVAADDVERVASLLRTAADVEWVSDCASLYQMRLEHLSRCVAIVSSRVERAETAVNTLARST
jgi:hypothetical protein